MQPAVPGSVMTGEVWNVLEPGREETTNTFLNFICSPSDISSGLDHSESLGSVAIIPVPCAGLHLQGCGPLETNLVPYPLKKNAFANTNYNKLIGSSLHNWV